MIEARKAIQTGAPPPANANLDDAATDNPYIMDEWGATMDNLVVDADRKLKKVATSHETLHGDLEQLVSLHKQVSGVIGLTCRMA